MGFPTDFFPVLFAIPRIAGWLAHWRESLQDESQKIWRPRQIYVGEHNRHYVRVDKRVNADANKARPSALPVNTHPFNRRYVVSMKSKL